MAEKAKRKHLHQIRSEQAEDGSIVHHHTYKKKKGDRETEPERRNVAVSDNADEAGQHTAEQFGMNDQAAAPDPGEADPTQPDPSQGDPTGAAPAAGGGVVGM